MEMSYSKIFEENRLWVERKTQANPNYFTNLAKGQKPEFLWIGCADSRVPANEVTGTAPGDIFVHRNIANMVVHTDMNMLSVLDYAINVLEIKHVIVCGHYGCGGINTALGNQQVGLIDNWLRNIKDVYRMHKDEVDAIADPIKKSNRMVELNVQEQVYNLTKTSIIQNAWAKGKFLQVHGIVYDIANGILQDLGLTVGDNHEMDEVYKFDTRVLV